MSSPSTKEVVRDLERAEFLRMSTRTQLPTVNPLLGEVFGGLPPRGEGESPRQFDWNDAQVQGAELLEDGISGVKETSQAFRAAKIEVRDWAKKRREGVTGLRRRHRSHQKIMEGACGPTGLLLTGLDQPPVNTILGMREQSSLVLKQYEDPALPGKLAAIPKAETSGPAPDIDALAQDTRGDLKTFEGVQNGWNQAKKIRDEAYLARIAARKRLRGIIVNVARIQEGLYRLAGLDDLADRLRLTIRGSKSKKRKAAPPDASRVDTAEPGSKAEPGAKAELGGPSAEPTSDPSPTPPVPSADVDPTDL